MSSQRKSRFILPDSVFGRLVLVLVVGMMAAQFITSSIWVNVRHAQLLEAPTRLVAQRVADLVALLDADYTGTQVMRLASHMELRAYFSEAALPVTPLHDERDQEATQLLQRVFHERVASDRVLQLRDLQVQQDKNESRLDWLTLAGLRRWHVHYAMQMEYSPGQWLQIDSTIRPGWQEGSAWQVIADLLWRVYALRILLVVALVVFAVRWVVKPLSQLASAAQAMEQDVATAPALCEDGPSEVRHAAQAFNRMQRRILAHLEERDRFLAAVSHDLRSPITRMRLRLALLQSGGDAVQTAERLRADLGDMEALVESTLQYLQSGYRHGPPDRIDVDSLVVSLVEDLKALGHQVTVSGCALAPMEGHLLSLKRAVGNLLDNALRYGKKAEVHISADTTTVHIQVLDDGPGIEEAQQQRVRQAFVRIEASRNLETGGYGLGLAIVEAVALAHHGQLRLSNRATGGLCAELILQRMTQANDHKLM